MKLRIFFALFCLLLGGCFKTAPSELHLALGNPSKATNSPSNSDNYLMIKPQYVLSYNKSKGTANWVSWQLNQSWLGKVDRQNDFRPDMTLPKDWDKVVPTDYTNSGFDRGHIAPSGDRTRNIEDNSSTFLMVNMMPQEPDVNRGLWSDLESYCRSLVTREGKELYIIAGPEGSIKTIGKNRVVVPQFNWKIIVILDQPGSGVRGVKTNTRAIAVKVPNSPSVKGTNWRQYRVSIDRIEQETGYDFLSLVPKSIQDEIEKKIDNK